MSSGQLMYEAEETIFACSGRFSIIVQPNARLVQRLETAFTVFGFLSANSAVNAQTFSG